MERLLWYIFIRWNRNAAIGCVISFLHLHTVWKKKTWIVWPSNTSETCEEKRVSEACAAELKDGRCCLHPEKGAMQAVLCTATTPLLLRDPHPAAHLGWGQVLLVHLQILWSSVGWGMQEVHTHSPDFQLLVSGQHSSIMLELLPCDNQAPDTCMKCRHQAASFTHLVL